MYPLRALDRFAPLDLVIYVDELFATEPARRWPYAQACHLTADTDAELHEFAAKLGLRREWAQHLDHRYQWHHHYDLTANKRRKAVQLGAQEVSGVDQARRFLDGLHPS